MSSYSTLGLPPCWCLGDDGSGMYSLKATYDAGVLAQNKTCVC